MSRMMRLLTAVSAAALLSAAGTFAVRAQDPPAEAPAPAEMPAEAPAPADGAAPAAETPAEAPAEDVTAEPARDPNAIVARVGSQTVTEREVTLAQEAFGSELANVPPEQWRGVLVDAVVNMKVLAEAATEAGLDQSEEFKQRLEFLRMQALRNAYVESEVVNKLDDAALQEAYQTLVVAQHTPEQQVHARHILVDTKEQAEKIIADLKGGAAFEELAKQSKDPSGENGGDLGFFGAGQMVPPFEQAAFALEPGEFTQEPVQSEFGWHVIRVEEKRMSAPPTFAEVEEQLRSYVLRQSFEEAVRGLREKYTVEILDPTAMPPAPEPVPATEEPAPAEQPATEVPATETPATETPTTEEPAAEEPATETPTTP